MLKKTLFQLHWLLGISAGLVLAVMGAAGAGLSFQDELLRALNPGVLTVSAPAAAQPLSPDALVARLGEQLPGRQVLGLTLSSAPEAAVKVNLSGKGPRGENLYADPYTGKVLGQPSGEAFFGLLMRLHRWLALGDVGGAITGASTLALVFLCLSGLYLRWPREGGWRAWLAIDWGKSGRSFLWDLHAVVGTWVLLVYLLAALTGLYWSYDGFRGAVHAMAGEPATHHGPPRGAPKAEAGGVSYSVDAQWRGFLAASAGRYEKATLRLPEQPGHPAQVTFLPADAAHERAFDRMQIAADGVVLQHERFADKSAAKALLGSVYPLHTGSYFGLPGRLVVFLAAALMPLLAITGWQLYLDRRRSRKALEAVRGTAQGAGEDSTSWLLLFASQNGAAEKLAWETAAQLRGAGQSVEVRALGLARARELQGASRLLVVASTFASGEAPDNGKDFVQREMGRQQSLGHLRYAVLGLGDRRYSEFCGFARSLDAWLRGQGAQSLFPMVEVDRLDAAAIATWHKELEQHLAGR